VQTVTAFAFRGCHDLTSVTIPRSAIFVFMNSFDGMKSLQNIYVSGGNSLFRSRNGVLYDITGTILYRFPEGRSGEYTVPSETTTIADGAFRGCSGLTKVTLPEGLLTITTLSFSQCTSLKEIVIPSSLSTMSIGAFDGCTSLTNVTFLPGKLLYVPILAFYGCSKLKTVSLPDNIISVLPYAFSGCNSLKKIVLPEYMLYIGLQAFNECGLVSIRIPANVMLIGINAFGGCSSLREFIVDGSNPIYKSVGGVLFLRRSGQLVTLPRAWSGVYNIPETVTYINDLMFSGCHKLTGITIPSSVQFITNNAFSGCSSLTYFEVNESNTHFKSIDGVLFTHDDNVLFKYPEGKCGTYTIPDFTTSIGVLGFHGCKCLRSVTIPSNVRLIRRQAFDGCNSLETVDIESGVRYIDIAAFRNCANLKSASISSSVVAVGLLAFSGCSKLTSVQYDGTLNPCIEDGFFETFGEIENMGHVCLPPNYKDTTFCKRTDFCLAASCEDLHFSADRCHEDTCENGKQISGKRKNATKWEELNLMTACAEFQCHDELGPIQWSVCNCTETERYMCTNDGCMLEDFDLYVEIVVQGLQASDMNLTRVTSEIKELTKVNVREVGYELGDNAFVVRIIVLIDDEDDGAVITESVNNLDKKEKCKFDVLCKSSSARMTVSKSLELLSKAPSIHDTATVLLLCAVMMINVIVSFITN